MAIELISTPCVSSTCSSLSCLASVEAALFDIDGTLCNLDPVYFDALCEMLQEIFSGRKNVCWAWQRKLVTQLKHSCQQCTKIAKTEAAHATGREAQNQQDPPSEKRKNLRGNYDIHYCWLERLFPTLKIDEILNWMEILADQECPKSIKILDQCRDNCRFKLPQISQNISRSETLMC
ncbi:hypothetical protein LguiB_028354 [Lonicera macranthoides]